MSAGTAEFFCLICFLVCSCTAQEIIKANVGQDVILPCKAPHKYNINNVVVEWIRPELDADYVLLYREAKLDQNSQLSFYQNRVDLQDNKMKDGDFSLVLKNMTLFDDGKYKCRVSEAGKDEHISITYLVFLPPDCVWIIIGLAFGWIVSVAAIIPLIVLFFHTRRQNSNLKTLVNRMQEELERLDEMNFDTNSDPTGSHEKNQQEELEKLQDENQKWMKTVVNLKTELQNMNQELKPITERISGCCPSSCCKNVSTGADEYSFSKCSRSPP